MRAFGSQRRTWAAVTLESIRYLHYATCRDHSPDGRGSVGRRSDLRNVASRGAAHRRVPDDPGDYALSGRQRRRDDVCGDRAAGEAIRYDAESSATHFTQLSVQL